MLAAHRRATPEQGLHLGACRHLHTLAILAVLDLCPHHSMTKSLHGRQAFRVLEHRQAEAAVVVLPSVHRACGGDVAACVWVIHSQKLECAGAVRAAANLEMEPMITQDSTKQDSQTQAQQATRIGPSTPNSCEMQKALSCQPGSTMELHDVGVLQVCQGVSLPQERGSFVVALYSHALDSHLLAPPGALEGLPKRSLAQHLAQLHLLSTGSMLESGVAVGDSAESQGAGAGHMVRFLLLS